MEIIEDLYAVMDNRKKAIPVIKKIIKKNPNNELLIKILSPLLIKNNIVYTALWKTHMAEALNEIKKHKKRIFPSENICLRYTKDHDRLYKGRRYDSIK